MCNELEMKVFAVCDSLKDNKFLQAKFADTKKISFFAYFFIFTFFPL